MIPAQGNSAILIWLPNCFFCDSSVEGRRRRLITLLQDDRALYGCVRPHTPKTSSTQHNPSKLPPPRSTPKRVKQCSIIIFVGTTATDFLFVAIACLRPVVSCLNFGAAAMLYPCFMCCVVWLYSKFLARKSRHFVSHRFAFRPVSFRARLSRCPPSVPWGPFVGRSPRSGKQLRIIIVAIFLYNHPRSVYAVPLMFLMFLIIIQRGKMKQHARGGDRVCKIAPDCHSSIHRAREGADFSTLLGDRERERERKRERDKTVREMHFL